MHTLPDPHTFIQNDAFLYLEIVICRFSMANHFQRYAACVTDPIAGVTLCK